MINRVIKRNEPVEKIVKSLVQDFLRFNPDVDLATVSIYEGKPKRSDAQHRLYFAWRDICQEEWSGKGVENKNDLHEYYKDTFIEGRSTKSLSVQEFVNFLNEIDQHAANLGVILPRTNNYEEAMYGKY
jgi:hypothetical protein